MHVVVFGRWVGRLIKCACGDACTWRCSFVGGSTDREYMRVNPHKQVMQRLQDMVEGHSRQLKEKVSGVFVQGLMG